MTLFSYSVAVERPNTGFFNPATRKTPFVPPSRVNRCNYNLLMGAIHHAAVLKQIGPICKLQVCVEALPRAEICVLLICKHQMSLKGFYCKSNFVRDCF